VTGRNAYERASGVWVIPDALPTPMAERTSTFLDREIHPSWWFRGVSGAEKIPDTAENSTTNKLRIRVEQAAAARGEFAYSFRRTVSNHVETCDCPVCKALKVFASPSLTGSVSSLTNVSVSVLGHSFASYFASGDFLATHTDKDNGKLAFVWNLTAENWKPQWGGMLHLLTTDWRDIQLSITPKFNELVLFDVRGQGKPHFVSQVIAGVTEKRLAISGWFF
jgi:hypothetical protein